MLRYVALACCVRLAGAQHLLHQFLLFLPHFRSVYDVSKCHYTHHGSFKYGTRSRLELLSVLQQTFCCVLCSFLSRSHLPIKQNVSLSNVTKIRKPFSSLLNLERKPHHPLLVFMRVLYPGRIGICSVDL